MPPDGSAAGTCLPATSAPHAFITYASGTGLKPRKGWLFWTIKPVLSARGDSACLSPRPRAERRPCLPSPSPSLDGLALALALAGRPRPRPRPRRRPRGDRKGLASQAGLRHGSQAVSLGAGRVSPSQASVGPRGGTQDGPGRGGLSLPVRGESPRRPRQRRRQEPRPQPRREWGAGAGARGPRRVWARSQLPWSPAATLTPSTCSARSSDYRSARR